MIDRRNFIKSIFAGSLSSKINTKENKVWKVSTCFQWGRNSDLYRPLVFRQGKINCITKKFYTKKKLKILSEITDSEIERIEIKEDE